ncbi:MAG: trypsin-like peptidase domain-containing protein [Holosporales bacterium]|jgi:S1-C subfamily serine protease|nr:trypsin-like peptidase domain-containing protein [Holosporales bacterium]
MKDSIKLIFVLSLSFVTSVFSEDNNKQALEKIEQTPVSIPVPEVVDKKSEKMVKEKLFNMIRNGVVVIKAKTRITKCRYYPSTEWEGTGFIADLAKGLIVTNAHVAGEMNSISSFEIKFGNGTKTEARIEYIDPCYDLAILSVAPENIPSDCIALEISDEDIKINMKIFAMGDSWGNSFSTYQGIVFDKYSIIGLKTFPEQSFQFSGLTVSGASGSPVFRTDGKVVGIIYGGAFVSGCALPSSYILPIVNAVKNKEKIKRFFSGCIFEYTTVQDLHEAGVIPTEFFTEYNKQFPEAKNKTLYVQKRIFSSKKDKEKDGLMAGDVIISIDETQIGCHLQKIEEIIQKNQDKKIKVCVYRDGRKENVYMYPTFVAGLENFKLLSFDGATFYEVTDKFLGQKNGVYIQSPESSSPFHEFYDKGGKLIKTIDGEKIKTLDDIFKIIPNLFKKKWLKISGTGNNCDDGEIVVWGKHESKIIGEATYYTYNSEKNAFGVKRIANPVKSEE